MHQSLSHRKGNQIAIGATSSIATSNPKRLKVFAATTVFLLASCSTGAPLLTDLEPYEMKLRQAAMYLDALAEDLDRYGTISVSTPGVVLDLGARAAKDLKVDAKELLAPSKRQGFSVVNSQQELQVRVSLAAQLSQAGLGDLAAKILAPPATGTKDGDNGDDTDKQVKAPDLPAADASRIAKAFSKPLGTPSADDNGLTLRQRILLAKDNQMALAAANVAGSPKAEAFGKNKRLYAAVFSVSLRPGRETYRNHVGEVELSVEFAYKKDKKDPLPKRWGGRHPLVFAAFPALDSQVLDLRRSDRRLLAIGAALEASVPQAAGKIGAEFRRLFEADRATLESRNTVIGFNSGGNNIGWRFTPQFTAQGNPAAKNPKPANRLFEQSFRALVFFLADKEDICTGFGGTTVPDTKDGIPCANHFIVKTTTRWLRAPDQASDQSWVPFSGVLSRARQNRLSEMRATDWGIRLDRARKLAIDAKISAADTGVPLAGGEPNLHSWRNFVSRYNAMIGSTIGRDVFTAIPKPKSAKKPPNFALTSVAPAHGWSDADTYIVAQGRGFGFVTSDKDKKTPSGSACSGKQTCAVTFYVGGHKIEPNNVALDGRTAVIKVPKETMKGATDTVDVTAVHMHGGSATVTNAIRFDLSRKGINKTEPDPAHKLTVAWSGKGADRRISKLTVHGKPVPADVLAALTKATTKTNPAKVNVNIAATSKSSK